MAYLNFYYGICLKELRNVTKYSQDNCILWRQVIIKGQH